MTIREIKQDAKLRTKGSYVNLIIINVLYLLITAAFTYVSSTLVENENTALLGNLLAILVAFITLPFSYGVLASTLKIVRGEDTSSTEFINIGLKNFSKVLKIFFRIFFKIFLLFFVIAIAMAVLIYLGASPNGIIAPLYLIIAAVLYITAMVYVIYKLLSYTLANYILYDNPEKNTKEILLESEKNMKGKKWKYIGLNLSFIGWYLLLGVIAYFITIKTTPTIGNIAQFVMTTILTPYITASQVVFYEDIKGSIPEEKTEEN